MKKTVYITIFLTVLVLLYAMNCYSPQTMEQETAGAFETTGIFEGRIITEGNFHREDVYKINGYCISLKDITREQAESLKGKKVHVTGELKIVKGKVFPAKTSTDGTIYEPYREPDKKFIRNPVFTVTGD